MKHTKLTNIFSVVLLLGCFELAFAEPAGNVIRVNGTASSTEASGKNHALLAGAAVNIGDVISTAKNSAIQIQMKDGAIIALTGDAVLKFAAYTFNDKSGAKDHVHLVLQKGRLRTITGSSKKGGYSLQTPSAIVHIQGTIYDTMVNPDNKDTSVVLREGAVVVESTCKDIGTGNTQLIDVPGMAATLTPCTPPNAPANYTQPTADLDAILPLDSGASAGAPVTTTGTTSSGAGPTSP